MCRSYGLILISFTVLCLAACRQGIQAADAERQSAPILQTSLTAPTGAPAAAPSDLPPVVQVAGVDGTRIAGKMPSYCWRGMCSDGGFEVETFQPVPPGPISIYLSEPIPQTVTLMLFAGMDAFLAGEVASSAEMAPDALTITWEVDVPSGDYILMVFSAWERDDASTLFGVTLP